jgi:hypothetical protein
MWTRTCGLISHQVQVTLIFWPENTQQQELIMVMPYCTPCRSGCKEQAPTLTGGSSSGEQSTAMQLL